MTELLQFLQFTALQILREWLREAARNGKTIQELLDEADQQTEINQELAEQIIAKLKAN